ncbi:hypothetical protein SMSP2_00172 [Limihaloglobus sulfuriphilus]|uniref:Uncharacterized protein n=1 Tax=Limihaloglobus sulfuriphilus TaxID=1851148 RepID=A0A1Q2MBD2_9BACT|nr:hypothetical protein SMSP2_00172 [Limihaloglobus sulfuriphilus]
MNFLIYFIIFYVFLSYAGHHMFFCGMKLILNSNKITLDMRVLIFYNILRGFLDNDQIAG